MGRFAYLLLVSVFICLGAPAAAMEIEPFYIRNQSPLVQIFGLPPAEGGELAGSGRTDARLVLDVASVFSGDENDQHQVKLDGEIYRLTLALRRGVGKRLEVGLDLPYIWHTGGGLDSFVDGFHRTFDLPEGGRDEWDRDQLRYVTISNGETRLRFEEPQDGIGDLLLSAGWSFYRLERGTKMRTLALRPAVKLPTGNGDDLTGSGSTDFSLRLAFIDGLSLADRGLSWFGTLGALLLSEGDILADQQKREVLFGTLGIGWAAYEWLNLQLQFDSHSPFYEGSDLCQLDDVSVQLAIGVAAALPGDIRLDFAVVEDLVPDTAPDVVFHLALRHLF